MMARDREESRTGVTVYVWWREARSALVARVAASVNTDNGLCEQGQWNLCFRWWKIRSHWSLGGQGRNHKTKRDLKSLGKKRTRVWVRRQLQVWDKDLEQWALAVSTKRTRRKMASDYRDVQESHMYPCLLNGMRGGMNRGTLKVSSLGELQ